MSRKPEFQERYRPIGIPDAVFNARLVDQSWSNEWQQIGQRLWEGRKRLQISKREAAHRAGISETLWRQLEGGGKIVDGRLVDPNPLPENLYGAFKAIGEDATGAFAFLHWDLPEPLPTKEYDDRLEVKLSRLSEHHREVIEKTIDAMLVVQARPLQTQS